MYYSKVLSYVLYESRAIYYFRKYFRIYYFRKYLLYESTTTTVLPADVPSYFPKVRMYNYFISYENTFESNVVHLYSVHIPSYNLLYFRIPSHLVLIRLVVMARAGG